MRDLIERRAAIDAVCKAGCDSGFCGVECDEVLALRNMPSAQPYDYSDGYVDGFKQGQKDAQTEIIRCGECRYYIHKANIESVEFGKCLVTHTICLCEDYCSLAERKEGEADEQT